MRAGTVYIVMALAGEVALLVGLILGADAAGSMDIVDVREALGPLPLALLVIGFGIKAGLVPLHVWLPLAHPAAPVPASAVLSGAIVKAGLFGLMLFLPEGAFGPLLMGLGLAGAFGAALWGLTQADPKAVLAYSTISQMGLMIMLVGAGGAARETVAYFALHHGFAKGALFLSVGVMLAARARWQRLTCMTLAGLVSASVAGLPLTGGALAKAAVKGGLPDAAVMALSLSSVTTTLILVWFLHRLWHLHGSEERRAGRRACWCRPWRCAGLRRPVASLAGLERQGGGVPVRAGDRPGRALAGRHRPASALVFLRLAPAITPPGRYPAGSCQLAYPTNREAAPDCLEGTRQRAVGNRFARNRQSGDYPDPISAQRPSDPAAGFAGLSSGNVTECAGCVSYRADLRSLLDLCGLAGRARPDATRHFVPPVGAFGAWFSIIEAADAPGDIGQFTDTGQPLTIRSGEGCMGPEKSLFRMALGLPGSPGSGGRRRCLGRGGRRDGGAAGPRVHHAVPRSPGRQAALCLRGA